MTMKPERQFVTPPSPTFNFYLLPLSSFGIELAYHFHPTRISQYICPPNSLIILLIGVGAKGASIVVRHTYMLLWANSYLLFYSWIGFNGE